MYYCVMNDRYDKAGSRQRPLYPETSDTYIIQPLLRPRQYFRTLKYTGYNDRRFRLPRDILTMTAT